MKGMIIINRMMIATTMMAMLVVMTTDNKNDGSDNDYTYDEQSNPQMIRGLQDAICQSRSNSWHKSMRHQNKKRHMSESVKLFTQIHQAPKTGNMPHVRI